MRVYVRSSQTLSGRRKFVKKYVGLTPLRVAIWAKVQPRNYWICSIALTYIVPTITCVQGEISEFQYESKAFTGHRHFLIACCFPQYVQGTAQHARQACHMSGSSTKQQQHSAAKNPNMKHVVDTGGLRGGSSSSSSLDGGVIGSGVPSSPSRWELPWYWCIFAMRQWMYYRSANGMRGDDGLSYPCTNGMGGDDELLSLYKWMQDSSQKKEEEARGWTIC